MLFLLLCGAERRGSDASGPSDKLPEVRADGCSCRGRRHGGEEAAGEVQEAAVGHKQAQRGKQATEGQTC